MVQTDLMRKMPFLKKRIPFSLYHERAYPAEQARKALGDVRPLSMVNIGNWRRHLPRIAGQLHQHGSISEDLIAYGYEPDTAWERNWKVLLRTSVKATGRNIIPREHCGAVGNSDI